MGAKVKFQPSGVIPACILPFNDDLSINVNELRKHVIHEANIKGVTSLCMNGHACEVHALTFEEQQLVLETTMDAVGDHMAIMAGVFAEGHLVTKQVAKMSEKAGASSLLVGPPSSTWRGGQMRPEVALAHVKTIADATDLPLVLFQYSMVSGLGYPHETLLRLCEEVPNIVAIKDSIQEPLRHERHIHELAALPRPVKVLTTHSAWLMASLVMGCDGLLSGAGSIIADLQAALLAAVLEKDMAKAQELNKRYYILAQLFYTPPFMDCHNRMKEAMVHIGRLTSAAVRPPEVKLSEAEIRKVRQVADQVGLRKGGMEDLQY